MQLEDLPVEILHRLPDDPRAMQINHNLARIFRDQAIAAGFTERPPAILDLQGVESAIMRLERQLPDRVQLRDAPLAALAAKFGQIPLQERHAAHVRVFEAASACVQPTRTLVELVRQIDNLPPAQRPETRTRIATHPGASLALATRLAEDMLDPRVDMPALREVLPSLTQPEQAVVLGRVAETLSGLSHIQIHEVVTLAVQHHDLRWPPEAASWILGRIGWLPPTVQAAFERHAGTGPGGA